MPHNISKTPSRLAFNKEVRAFKRQHSVKLKDLFCDEGEARQKTRQAFFQNAIIRPYLERSADSLFFSESHPDLRRGPVKLHSDAYELNIYKYASRIVPFRDHADSTKFYSLGTRNGSLDLYFDALRKMSTQSMLISRPLDIYQIRELINEMEWAAETAKEASKKTSFVAIPNFKDDHATLLIAVLDEQQRALVTVFINSLPSAHYTGYLSYRFNLRQYSRAYTISISEEQLGATLAMLDEKFGTGLPEPGFLHDPETRTAYVRGDRGFYLASEITAELDRIYYLDDRALTMQRTVPFLDASHGLQLSEGDKNCCLYSLNFLKAACSMLSEPSTAHRVQDYAKAVSRGDIGASEKLIRVFQEEIKAYLPAYYTADRQPRSFEELKQYHLKQRWNIGKETLDAYAAVDYTHVSERPR